MHPQTGKAPPRTWSSASTLVFSQPLGIGMHPESAARGGGRSPAVATDKRQTRSRGYGHVAAVRDATVGLPYAVWGAAVDL